MNKTGLPSASVRSFSSPAEVELSPASRKRAFEEKRQMVLATCLLPSIGNRMKEARPPKFVRDQMEAVLDLQTEAEIVEQEAQKLEEEIRRMEADLDDYEDTEDEDTEDDEEETDEESDDELEDEEEEDIENEEEKTDEEDNDWRRHSEEQAKEETQEEKDDRASSGAEVAVRAACSTRNRFIKDVLMSRRPRRVSTDPARC